MKKSLIVIGALISISIINIFASHNNYQKITTTTPAQPTDTLKVDSLLTQPVKKEEAEIPAKPTNIVKVSWYGDQFHGRKTANGERFDMHKFSAAHKKLPFGTKVKITNLLNGKSVIVVINDRGPYVKNREFDLSKAAFREITSEHSGVIKVTFEIIS